MLLLFHFFLSFFFPPEKTIPMLLVCLELCLFLLLTVQCCTLSFTLNIERVY